MTGNPYVGPQDHQDPQDMKDHQVHQVCLEEEAHQCHQVHLDLPDPLDTLIPDHQDCLEDLDPQVCLDYQEQEVPLDPWT